MADENEHDRRDLPINNELGAYVASELAGAKADYQVVRNRALNLVSTSGGFVALVSGLLAIAAGVSKSSVPIDARFSIALSLAAFVVSAIFALNINRPQTVTSSGHEQLAKFVENNWNDVGWDKSIALISVEYLATLRQNNKRTTQWLSKAITYQIVGILLIAISVLLILVSDG